jgi:WD40 repeat protein
MMSRYRARASAVCVLCVLTALLTLAARGSSGVPRRGRSGAGLVGALLLAIALLASACRSAGAPTFGPLPDLRLSGVAKIPGINELEQRVNIHDILSITTYAPAGAHGAGARVLFSLGGTIYDVSLDGRDLHPLGGTCPYPDSVSPDGVWLICNPGAGIRLMDLRPGGEDAALHLSPTGIMGFGSPVWAPNGRQLAVMSSEPEPCTIAIYAVVPERATATRKAQLTLPQFATSGPGGAGCAADAVAWSPDGAWLSCAVITAQSAVYAVPLANALARTRPTDGVPTVELIPDLLVTAAVDIRPNSAPVWSPVADTLTFVSRDGASIREVNVRTGEQRTLLTQRVADIFAVSWTPDGQHLVFVLGLGHDENLPPPAQIYVYTPPAEQP